MKFFEILRSLRESRGISQAEMAKILGISTHGYQRYEYGHQEPRISLLIAIADFYDVSLDELVGRERFLNREKV